MREFLQFSHESRHIPFPSLVTSLVEAAGMRGSAKEKRVLPRLGPITNKTEAKSRAASTRPQPSQPPVTIPGVPPFIYSTSTYEHIPIEENGASNKRVVQMHFRET